MARRAANGLLIALLMQVSASHASATVPQEPGAHLNFSATVGGGPASPRILLRWSSPDRPSAYARYLLKRRAAAEAVFTDLATLEALTDPADITALFTDPVNVEILADISSPNLLGPSYASELIARRTVADPPTRMQRELLQSTNYGVAIADGLGYLDTAVTAGTRYAYELWGIDPGTNLPVERLGKLWAEAGLNTVLPAPQGLRIVGSVDADLPPLGDFPGPGDVDRDDDGILDGGGLYDVDNPPRGNFPGAEDVDLDGDGRIDSGEPGNGKIFLAWDPRPALQAKDRETRVTGFGFDVYRFPKGGGPCPPVPPPAPAGLKINEFPILPTPATDPDIPDFIFVDDPASPGAPSVTQGVSYCYWAVARDLLRQLGQFSAPAVGCAPDLGRPRQVRRVATQVLAPSSSGVRVSWIPNRSDPVTLDPGTPYVDDTTGYHVYRFTDFGDLQKPPDPAKLVPGCTGLPGTVLSCDDPFPATQRGKIYWYTVTATDAPVCGNAPNESPFSSPARAVVYDESGPAITKVTPFCIAPQHPDCIRDCSVTPPSAWCHAGGASGVWPVRGDDWGYKVFPADLIDDNDDTFSVRLYRGSKGADFRPVEEASLLSPADPDFDLHEPFLPRVSQKLEYRLRALDLDSNLGLPGPAPIPAFVRGDPPIRPTLLEATYDPTSLEVQLKWHAPGAEALAGFLVRVGPRGRRDAGTFHLLPGPATFPPDGNHLFSEASVDPPRLPDDVTGDSVESPYVVVIRSQTKYLADLGANLGGLREPDGYLHASLPASLADDVEIYSVDITGQLSRVSRRQVTAEDLDPTTLDWPERDAPPAVGPLQATGLGDKVVLCWNQPPEGRCTVTRESCKTGADCSRLCDEEEEDCAPQVCQVAPDLAPRVAVFRAVVDPADPGSTSFQQRSPLIDIQDYNDGPPHIPCQSDCRQALGPTAVCWEDYGVVSGRAYRYSILRFWGEPGPDDVLRSEGEIRSQLGPVEVAAP